MTLSYRGLVVRLRDRFRRVPTLPAAGYPPATARFDLLDSLPDDQLKLLNDMLPWAAFTVDHRGRRLGGAYSTKKRTTPQALPDARIVELDRRVPLAGLRVLELGCFEGIHTAALCERAGHVVALDSRIENVVKTATRCAVLGYRPELQFVDLEDEPPPHLDLSCDVLHHVGVLYHLTDPIEHLTTYAKLTRRALMLDTHVAPDDGSTSTYRSGDRDWRYFRFEEAGRSSPFAGMKDHAKWLVLEELVELLRTLGFSHVDVAEERAERNGPRVLIYAER